MIEWEKQASGKENLIVNTQPYNIARRAREKSGKLPKNIHIQADVEIEIMMLFRFWSWTYSLPPSSSHSHVKIIMFISRRLKRKSQYIKIFFQLFISILPFFFAEN